MYQCPQKSRPTHPSGVGGGKIILSLEILAKRSKNDPTSLRISQIIYTQQSISECVHELITICLIY